MVHPGVDADIVSDQILTILLLLGDGGMVEYQPIQEII